MILTIGKRLQPDGRDALENNYKISLVNQPELILDVEDLAGIIMQLKAITNGWGMDFTPVEYDEIIKIWEWSSPAITSGI